MIANNPMIRPILIFILALFSITIFTSGQVLATSNLGQKQSALQSDTDNSTPIHKGSKEADQLLKVVAIKGLCREANVAFLSALAA